MCLKVVMFVLATYITSKATNNRFAGDINSTPCKIKLKSAPKDCAY